MFLIGDLDKKFMNIIGTFLIFSSVLIMFTEFHLKNDIGYLVFLATGIYIFISVFLFMPKQLMSFVREEGLVESKWKLNLVRFQVGAFFILSFICFVLELSKYEIPNFIYWVLVALMLTLTFTMMLLKYIKKR
ncbi:MAG: hypothetical protein DCE87_04890 [Betaproteobacteria bacterium]|nr:MAG: hypothetical protein DCE87_04890 [Betaproteobacteria bacterium]PZO25917.1 MAG: hypothetical protein DCE89_01550 [Betaproteobacteria bacterium]